MGRHPSRSSSLSGFTAQAAASFKPPQPCQHAKDVVDICFNLVHELVKTGKCVRLNKRENSILYLSALFHDIGKDRVPPELLYASRKLTEKEFDKVKEHTQFGYEYLKKQPIGFFNRYLKEAQREGYDVALLGEHDKKAVESISRTVRHHHEKLNGTGYPAGLKARNVSLGMRVVAVADAYHALRSKRSYKEDCPEGECVNTLWQEVRAGRFDGNVVEAMTFIADEGQRAPSRKLKPMREMRLAAPAPL
ncbi:MAG: HD domain-containing protein [Alphaproteobacteria bacterium]|nr:HD domain-containing protein [Alphaproteobacteria bacterium]